MIKKKQDSSTDQNLINLDNARIEKIYLHISGYLNEARQNVAHSIDTEQVRAYWLIGREINAPKETYITPEEQARR